MSRKGNGPRLDLKLNILPPPRPNPMRMESPRRRSMSISPSSSLTSMASSCVSSEVGSDENDQGQTHGYLSSPEPTSMVLVGCPCCLMYVMLSEDSPKCPKCNSTALLDFICDNKNSSNSTNNCKKN